MRITKVSVKGLFGMFDHEIPLNQESRITIIHGLNGVGKTVMLQILHDLFHYEYRLIGQIPFEQFCLEFENGESISVEKEITESDEAKYPVLLIQYKDGTGNEHIPFTPLVAATRILEESIKELRPDLRLVHMRNERPDMYWVSESEDLEVRIDEREVLTTEDLLRKYPLLHTEVYGKIPDWFAQFLNEASPIYISTARLKLESTGFELLRAIQQHKHFPGHYNLTPPRDTLSYFSDYFSYQAERLSDSDSHVDFRSRVEELNSEKDRISELHDFVRGSKMLLDIINERFLFKTLSIDEMTKYEFKIIAQNGSEVPLSTLSLGEQQLFVLYFQLLFEIQPDTLVMIDEPELSMNVVWQRNFVKDLQRIIELRNFDVLIATHSPQIIHDKWDWVVHLGEKVDD